MKFQISKPFYYQYSYISGSLGTGYTDNAFGAVANASLSETNDSAYGVQGNNCGVISAVVDKTSIGAAAVAAAPSAAADCDTNKTGS